MTYKYKKATEELQKNTEKNLENKREWWKAISGSHEVTIETDFHEFTTEWEGTTMEKVAVNISVEGDKFIWSISKGKSYRSLYGQLCLVAENHNNTLVNKTINLLVKGSGSDVDYTVVEAVGLIPTEQPKKEDEVK